jgi:hypothetical protein
MGPSRLRPVLIAAALVLVTGAASRDVRAAASACEFTGVDRVVAVGDVHGAYDRFVDILRTASLVDDKLRWTGARTHLVLLGDVVDRGPESAKALDLIERLTKDAAKAGGALHMLLGNHEVMRMLGDVRYVTPGEYSAFVSADSARVRDAYMERAKAAKEPVPDPPLGFVEMRIAFGQNGKYGKWLRTLPAVIHINDVVFVHGGISPPVAELSCDAINETIHRQLTTELNESRRDPLSQLGTRPDGPLWYRGLAEASEDDFERSVDLILSKQRARSIVIGHTVTSDSRVRSRWGGKVVQIDTGMQPAYVPTGRASALEMANGVTTAIYTDRRDVLSGAAR